MILNNKEKFDITLKAVNKDTVKNELVVKENGVSTLISEEKKIYLFLEPKDSKEFKLKELEGFVKAIVAGAKYDMNICMKSFMEVYSDMKEEAFRTVVEAVMYANHQMFSMKEKNSEPKTMNIMHTEEFAEIYNASEIKMEFVNFTRDLQDLPPNVGTSVEIAKRIEEKAKTIDGLKITIYGKKEIEDMKMGLLLSVNAGSHVDPRVVVLEYVGDSSKPKTALVGKGITFDSGGYNLKPSNFLDGMKFDMSGAAIMSSTVMALAKAKAKCNVTSIAMLTDNRIGGTATLTESVITSMNGKTVEINNTDAEGRLVLADGITYAVRNVKADRIIDAATLTGAIVVALGPWHTGVFSKSDSLWEEFKASAEVASERVWRQPMIPEHLTAMQISKIADLTNSEPGRNAGSSTAAAFLDSFAEGKDYLHLDIAGTADGKGRGTSVMLRSLFEMLSK